MTRLTGRVKWFSTEKGYGFIAREGAEDVFVHRSEIRGPGASVLEEGELVEFDVETSSRGLKARGVERAGSGAPTESEKPDDGAESTLPTLEEQLVRRLVPRFLRGV